MIPVCRIFKVLKSNTEGRKPAITLLLSLYLMTGYWYNFEKLSTMQFLSLQYVKWLLYFKWKCLTADAINYTFDTLSQDMTHWFTMVRLPLHSANKPVTQYTRNVSVTQCPIYTYIYTQDPSQKVTTLVHVCFTWILSYFLPATHMTLHNILPPHTSWNKGHLDIATEVEDLS